MYRIDTSVSHKYKLARSAHKIFAKGGSVNNNSFSQSKLRFPAKLSIPISPT